MDASRTCPDIPVASSASVQGASGSRLTHWVRHHDESWLFVAIYLGLAVGLSVFVSLFWLVVVAAFHFALELARQSYEWERPGDVVAHALWEVKLDIGLVLLALTLVLYIEVVLGILGLQSAARAGAATHLVRGSSRAAALEHWVRAGLLAVDELLRVSYAAFLMCRRDEARSRASGSPAARALPLRESDPDAGGPTVVGPVPARSDAGDVGTAPAPYRATPPPGTRSGAPAWEGTWGIADHIGLITVALGIILILAAPYLTPHEWDTAMAAMLRELRPIPM